MRNYSMVLLLISLTFIGCAQNDSKKEENSVVENTAVTTYYFIRHAEKDRSNPDDSNPHLTEKGRARAINWAKELEDVDFDAIYSTDYNRTMETAKPLADQNGLIIKTYDPNALNDEAFKNATKGKTVFVVGHSNTTPFFANAILGENKYDEMDDLNNSDLYIVTIESDSKKSEIRTIDF